jgi:hypothetical protein
MGGIERFRQTDRHAHTWVGVERERRVIENRSGLFTGQDSSVEPRTLISISSTPPLIVPTLQSF